MLTTYRGIVYPGQCDAMGHFNVAHYIAAFDQASWHLLHACGYSSTWIAERGEGFADVHYEVDFRHELRAGALFSIESCVVRTGTRSLTTYHRMVVVDNTQLSAELTAISVYFDLEARIAKDLPVAIQSGAAELIFARQTSK